MINSESSIDCFEWQDSQCPAPSSALMPGDLVFFQTSTEAAITPVGIYMGDGQFAHSSTKKGVILTNLSHGYYSQAYREQRALDTEPQVKHSFTMVKNITKVGNSHGIVFDAPLMELAHLKPGDQVNLEVHKSGTITLTPIRSEPTREEVSKVIKTVMKDFSRTMKRLA